MPAPPRPDRAAPAAALPAEGAPLAAQVRQPAPEMPLAAYAARLRGAGELLATAWEDRELARELMEMPALERIDAALHEPRFHRDTLARLLALEAESALDDPARNPCPVAELAAAIASCLPRDAQGKARRAAAWAYWLLGKALLGASQWRLAEGAFEGMCAFIPRGERSEEEALACAGLAQVREDTGNVDAAAALYLRAAWLFAKLGSAAPAAASQAQLGLLLHESGDLVNATLPLRGALGLLDPAFAPSLAARLWLALAQIQAMLGDTAAAESLRRAQALYPLAPSPEEAIARRWHEAKIALAAGEDAVAEARLDRVRRALLARGSLLEAARSTFEQLLLTIDGQRFDAARELVAALAAAAPGGGEPWAGAMADLVRLAADQPGASYQAGLDLKRRLRHAPPIGADRAPLLRSSRHLADRLLRQQGELEAPVGAAAGL